MRRRLALVLALFLAAVLGAFVLPSPALASSSLATARAQARQLQSQIASLNNQMEIVVERYDTASQTLSGLTKAIGVNENQLQDARDQLVLAQQQLAEQVVAMYEAPPAGVLDVVLATRSFSDLTSWLTLYESVGEQSATTVKQITALKSSIEQRHTQLLAERSQAKRLVTQLTGQKTQILASLQQRQHLLQSAQSEVRRLLQQIQQAQAAAAARAAAAAQAAVRRAAAQALTQQSASSSSGSSSSAGDSGGTTSVGGGGTSAAISIAQRYLGVPYVWGGASPAGFDCSGLVMYVFAQLGIALPHSAHLQFTYCTPVPRADLQPGDLVFFGSSAATIHHVGIYVGNDTMLDAPCTGEDVRYDVLFSDFYSGGRL